LTGISLEIRLRFNERNTGFAGATDEALRALLAETDIERVLLLNNDAIATAAMASWMQQARGDMCAARVMNRSDPTQVDSLGIVMYRSGLASNRLSPDEPLFGPTGGCAIYSRRLLQALLDRHGYIFDERFFCYAEDTDVAFRALLLGFKPSYNDNTVALHSGQASSGGKFNDFVLYHGIRNSLWVLVKCMPTLLLLRWLPWISIMYLAVVVLHVRQGRFSTVFRLYRDASIGLRRMLRSRRSILTPPVAATSAIMLRIERSFYAGGRLRSALVELLFGKRKAKASALDRPL
jgi:GT2 family glycosyltransferase